MPICRIAPDVNSKQNHAVVGSQVFSHGLMVSSAPYATARGLVFNGGVYIGDFQIVRRSNILHFHGSNSIKS
jgi:hypothetical protein